MKSIQTTEKVREDFDRLADLSDERGWDHNNYYHASLLKHLPAHCFEALEVGCGTGDFARLLAERCERVLAIDLSPRMVEVARDRSKGHPNIEYAVADASSWEFPEECFDCVASIMTLHHLPLAPTVSKITGALKPGGTLLLLDLYQAQSVIDYLSGALGFAASRALNLAKTGSFANHQSPEVQRAWEEHGRTDTYPTLAEVRRVRDEELPEAEIRRRLLWRYSLVWRKPVS